MFFLVSKQHFSIKNLTLVKQFFFILRLHINKDVKMYNV